MIKRFIILAAGVAALHVWVCAVDAGQGLFENVGQTSGPPVSTDSLPVPLSTQTPSGSATRDSKPDLFAFSPSAALAPTNSVMDSLDNHYPLGPGDTVLYQVIEDQDVATNLTVTDSGNLEVPYYGLIHAAGKTCRQVALEIKPLLEKKLYYQATVVIALNVVNKTWVTGKVYVTGQVRNPGGYDIKTGEAMTVSKAILNAGGFSDFSDKKHVRLIRKTANGDQTSVVNVLDVWKGQLNQDLTIQPGDLVVVPARMVNY